MVILFLRAEISKEALSLLAAIVCKVCMIEGCDKVATFSVDMTTKIVHARAIFLCLLACSIALNVAPCLASPPGWDADGAPP